MQNPAGKPSLLCPAFSIFAAQPKHMKTKQLLTALLFISSVAAAQDVDVKDNAVLADGITFLRYEKEGCKMFSSTCVYNISDTAGKKEIVIQGKWYNDWAERKQSNPEGKVAYYEVVFLASGKKAELKHMGIGSEKKLMKTLVKAKLFENGQLNQKAVDEFVLVNGTPFSERRTRM